MLDKKGLVGWLIIVIIVFIVGIGIGAYFVIENFLVHTEPVVGGCAGVYYEYWQECCENWAQENGIVRAQCVGNWTVENNVCKWICETG